MLPERLTTTEPALAAALVAYVDGVRTHPALPAGLLDACGARIAWLLAGRATGPTAPAAHRDGAASDEPTADEPTSDETAAACLAFAEQFVLDAQALDERTVGRVRGAVGDAGYAVLALGVGLMEGLVRARLAWGLPPLPPPADGPEVPR